MLAVAVLVSAATGAALVAVLVLATSRLLALPLGMAATMVAAGVAAGLSALAGWRFQGQSTLPSMLWLVSIGVVLCVIDLRYHRLPDPVVGLLFLGGFVLLGAAAVHGDLGVGGLGRSLAASGVVLGGGLLVLLLAGTGLGRGDVTFAAALAAYLGAVGWPAVPVALAFGFVLLGVSAVWTVVVNGGGRQRRLAAGPALFLGAVGTALFFAP